jgi:hypothetical protein
MAIAMAKTFAKSVFQPDRACIAAEPFSNHQEGSGVDLDYIVIKI